MKCQGRSPDIVEETQADAAIAVDSWMVDACVHSHLWWLERIVVRQCDLKDKCPSLVESAWLTLEQVQESIFLTHRKESFP